MSARVGDRAGRFGCVLRNRASLVKCALALAVSIIAYAAPLLAADGHVLVRNVSQDSKVGEGPPFEAKAAQDKWTPDVSVGVRYFTTPLLGPQWVDVPTENVIYSPDRSKFFVLSYRGNIECDCLEWALDVYLVSDIRKLLISSTPSDRKPFIRLTRFSKGKRATEFGRAQWSADGKSILFLSADDREKFQIHRLDVQLKVESTLTNESAGVDIFSAREKSIYFETRNGQSHPKRTARYPLDYVDANLVGDAISPADTSSREAVGYYIDAEGARHEVKTEEFPTRRSISPIWHSQDGRFIVLLRRPIKDVEAWHHYLESLQTDNISSIGQRKSLLPAFVIVDTHDHRAWLPFDSPVGAATALGKAALVRGVGTDVFFLSDHIHAVFVNTALPINAHEMDRQRLGYVVVYNMITRQVTKEIPVQSMSTGALITRVTEGPGNGGVNITYDGGRREVTILMRRGMVNIASRKRQLSVSAKGLESRSGDVTVTVEEDQNTPPVLVARLGDHQITLSDPDPQLARVSIAPMRAFNWRTASGHEISGGLILPPHAQGRVPLVIQAYRYLPNQFRPDGPFPSAYAAQALAANGIAVLNLNLPEEGIMTLAELTEFSDRIETAVKELSRNGMVDSTKVGLIGFSRGGFLSYYAITHPQAITIKAAIIDDAWTGTYPFYLFWDTVAGTGLNNYEGPYGGSFWNAKEKWLDSESSFNVDRVRGATLFTVHGEQQIPLAFIEIGGFKLNRKPLDYRVFPAAGHQLTKPAQRRASMELTVDWMLFWLKGEEDKSPLKSEQYVRWRDLEKC